jgi:hypothetical protein
LPWSSPSLPPQFSGWAAGEPVTFAKDVAPILQDKCRPAIALIRYAPMSLVTYEETRPWPERSRRAS